MKKYLNKIAQYLMLIPLCTVLSCGDFLDVVPDEIPSLDDAFLTRNAAEGFLVGLFSYLPEHGNPAQNPALTGGDEIWHNNMLTANLGYSPYTWYYLALGGSNTTGAPACSYFASADSESKIKQTGGLRGGRPLWTAIRDCNVFIEYVTDPNKKPFDLSDKERDWWVGNAEFLKAYYYFWLFRMYGPIPLKEQNLPITASSEESQSSRCDVDQVVDFIISLLDKAMPNLPKTLDDPDGVGTGITRLQDLGLPTRVVAKALKAQLLVYAASPLFNNNPDYASYGKDDDGDDLFPQNGDYVGKWQRARDALKEAIDFAEQNGHQLYRVGVYETGSVYTDMAYAKDPLIAELEVRGAVTDNPLRNTELIWGDSRRADLIEQNCRLVLDNDLAGIGNGLYMGWAPTLTIIEQFYSKNGVPIEEDWDWQGHLEGLYGNGNPNDPDHGLYALRGIPSTGEYDLQMMRGTGVDTATAYLHFDREPRFYGAISFDRGRYFGGSETPFTNFKAKETVAATSAATDNLTSSIAWATDFKPNHAMVSSTGYLCKKMIGTSTTMKTRDGKSGLSRYFFPIIRLADLYLMYAEALNESDPSAATGDPDETNDRNSPFTWLNKIRTRTHLQTVGVSWNTHSIKGASGYNTQDALRKIIQRERLNELAFEGQRFWDLRRWKLALDYMQKPIRGLNVRVFFEQSQGKIRPDGFYTVQTLVDHSNSIDKRIYFWPIALDDVMKNPKLLQSPFYENREE